MANFSNYLEGQLLNHIFRSSTFNKPSVLAIALVTVAIIDSDTGSTITEVANANGYVRQVLNPSDSNWSDASGGDGTTDNLANINFPIATGSWGTIVGLAILDNSTYGAGNILFFGNLSADKTINNGDIFAISIGDLGIQFN